MSKRNIAYVKPQEPSFLRRLKEQIGYKEGPTVDTKREALDIDEEDDELIEEEPTVVVLKSGDLTAEEAAQAKEQIEKEKTEAPADLNQRVIFKAPEKPSNSDLKGTKRASSEKLDKNKEKKSKSKPLLSFDDEENDDL